jgi:hypothetical protein
VSTFGLAGLVWFCCGCGSRFATKDVVHPKYQPEIIAFDCVNLLAMLATTIWAGHGSKPFAAETFNFQTTKR